jgi:hypothetical protein
MKALRALMASMLLLAACTTEQAYNTAQGWQRNRCGRIPDKAEFERCMSEASRSHDEYKRQTQPEKK